MKKLNLIVIALLTPVCLFAQAGGNEIVGGLSLFLIAFAIALGVFLLIRSILLWYWKVDIIVKNQEYNNKLLEYNGQLLKEQNEFLKKLVSQNNGTTII